MPAPDYIQAPLSASNSAPRIGELLTRAAGSAAGIKYQTPEGAELSADILAAAAPKALEIQAIREIGEAEASEALSAAPRRGGAALKPAPTITELKTRHHEFARLMAAGLKDTEIARMMDCSLSHLSLLRRSPSFQSLLFSFMALRDQAAIDLGREIKETAYTAVNRARELLATTEDLESVGKVAFGLLDRAGHAPVQKSISVSQAITAEQIRELRDRRRAERAQDITPLATTLEEISGGGDSASPGGGEPVAPLAEPGS